MKRHSVWPLISGAGVEACGIGTPVEGVACCQIRAQSRIAAVCDGRGVAEGAAGPRVPQARQVSETTAFHALSPVARSCPPVYGAVMMALDDPDAQAGSEARQTLLALILHAYAVAKSSGKENWDRMYAGVLKNRMLVLTDGRFDQADWGATGFTSVLEFFPDVLRVDRGTKPPMVQLLDPGLVDSLSANPTVTSKPTAVEQPAAARPAADSRAWRIRRDLWDAVLGVRDPDAFIWENGAVVRVPQDQAMGLSGVRLPTLTGPELDSLQREFADQHTRDARYSSILETWARGDIRTAGLPRQLQHLWYAELKRHVRQRLEDWFEENGVPVPADMIELPSSGRVRGADSTSALRALVVACVQVMTEDELRQMRLPPAAVLKSQR